jgi:hypothetical protein
LFLPLLPELLPLELPEFLVFEYPEDRVAVLVLLDLGDVALG